MPGSVRARWIVAAVVLAVAAGAVVVSWPDSATAGDPEIAVSRSACGTGWAEPKPGPQTFRLHNTGSVTAEVDLIDPATGVIYGEVEGLGPDTTRPLQVNLGNGSYAFRCLPEDAGAIVGPAVRVTGGAERTGPGVAPVTHNDLLGPLKAYQQHVATGLGELVANTAALKDAVHGGDRAASEAAWLTAHLTYERLGAAYDAFGDSDGALNGTADGLPAGPADPGFTGFHRLEQGLWHGEDLGALAAFADRLDTDARALQASFGGSQVDGNDLGLRAHEIMENTLQFELTGRTDYGSGTNLATARANLDGTRAVLDVLRPLLAPRYPELSKVDSWLTRTQSALDAAHRPDGSWTRLAQLSQPQRQKLNADVGELTELLAPIAAIAEPRRVS
ncbi:iron uptake system component EfeO [Amycolatopsis lexingtonensis]|uniref:Iron uptake system component EfeO n=1 Tax=Amycolatopsis lexingtonensis TaxID=218822 RepID=A0ABR9IEG6_9PSEU|nr:EfeM/EfeO family lipoprotein [Amycolatopsis lexingtonensis]MBE1501565.1 iron uptake system component EfeO [Amycolatopsis lexingtonensis]